MYDRNSEKDKENFQAKYHITTIPNTWLILKAFKFIKIL